MNTPMEFVSSTEASGLPHICVCVCTYKRPQGLERLMRDLEVQETAGLFTFSLVVADNDEQRSGESVIKAWGKDRAFSVVYDVEPRRGIALARNKAVANARGDYLALIDDDEFPAPNWLLTLYRTCDEWGVDGVLGPVIRHFDEPPPGWLKRSNFYDRRINRTGTRVHWKEARTGNVLMKAKVVAGEQAPFRPEFRAGEDQDFFWRKIEAGFTFIWSADAKVYETIPPARWRRTYMLRKATLQGENAALQPNCDTRSILKSVTAIPLYTVALPLALLFGHHRFMTLLVKIFHHLGKLLALMGVHPVREAYVSD